MKLMIAVAMAVLAQAEQDDLRLLQGKWALVEVETHEKGKLPKDGLEGVTLAFSGATATYHISATKESGTAAKLEHAVVLNQKQSPKAIDFKPMGPRDQFGIGPGIYEVRGDELRLCIRIDMDTRRPTEFKAGPGVNLLVFKRIKEKK